MLSIAILASGAAACYGVAAMPARPLPRPRAPRMPPEARRAQLVASAVRVFARRGLGAARHAEVAAEAGVSLPAVFFYFETRERLVAAVLDEVARHFLGIVADALALDVPPRERLLATARAFAASVERHPDHARVWLDWSTAVRDELWPRYLRFQARVLQSLTRTIRTGQRRREIRADVTAADAALVMYGAAYVVMQLQLRGATPARIARFVRNLMAAVAPAA